MSNRRALIQGINPDENIDPDLAEDFIAGRPLRGPAKPETPVASERSPSNQELPAPASPAQPLPVSLQTAATSPLTGVGRVPVGARIRTELAASLKRASLERQLHGIQPNSMQDILEEAVELWLHRHGLLK